MLCLYPLNNSFASTSQEIPPTLEFDALPYQALDSDPELKNKLMRILEQPDFEVRIPRKCMVSQVLREKLKATPPDQRLKHLEDLMHRHALDYVVLINPAEKAELVTRLACPAKRP